MGTIEKTIEVGVPVRTAYDQWTQFEEFPEFMEGVERVQQVDEMHLLWTAEIAGVKREWDAEIVKQEPDHEVSWCSIGGARNDGTVSFTPLGADQTQVTLRLDFEPEGVLEKAGDLLHLLDLQVDRDLKKFKEFIERRQVQTGGWRGSVEAGEVAAEPISDLN